MLKRILIATCLLFIGANANERFELYQELRVKQTIEDIANSKTEAEKNQNIAKLVCLADPKTKNESGIKECIKKYKS